MMIDELVKFNCFIHRIKSFFYVFVRKSIKPYRSGDGSHKIVKAMKDSIFIHIILIKNYNSQQGKVSNSWINIKP